MEAAALAPVSGDGKFREAEAADDDALRSSRGGTGIANRSISPSQEPHANASSFVHSHRASPSVPLLDGFHATAADEMGRRVAGFDFPRAPTASAVGWSGNGRHPASAICSRRAGKFGGPARGKKAGQLELHVFERDARVLHRAVQA